MTNGKGSTPSQDSTTLAAAQAAATKLGVQYTNPNLTGDQRAQVRAQLVDACAERDRIRNASKPSPDDQLLLNQSMIASLLPTFEGEQR